MKHHLAFTTSTAVLILIVAPALADSSGFQGFYAPISWTVTGVGTGGASADFAPDGSALTITGFDGHMLGWDTDVTHVVATDGIWVSHWSFFFYDPHFGFDVAYYLINDDVEFLSYGGHPESPTTGIFSVPVHRGDVIGWRVYSDDGAFGPGVLTITNFIAPVPMPASFALLGLAAVPRARRRR